MKLLYTLLAFLLIESASANNFTTPGTGVKWTLDNLVANSGGDVTFEEGDYIVNDTIFINLNDTLSITTNARVKFAPNTYLDVNGTFIVNPPTSVVFTEKVTGSGFFGLRIDSSNTTVLRKLTLEYANSLRLFDCNPLIENCIFQYNSPLTTFGNAAISVFRSNPTITGCQFLNNKRAAIQGGSNIANAPKIINCLFQGNNTLNGNVPQINIGTTGVDTALILNNQILRASTNSGGIGFLPIGNVYVIIKGNVIKNNRYGMTFNGGANINAIISYNQVDSNNTQNDPILGGSGISFVGGTATSQQNSIVTGNLFRWNLWGITIQTRSRPNLGNLNNADTTDDGKNQFINNSNTSSTPQIDLYNNSVDTIYAQNNYWGTIVPAEVEAKIFHLTDNPALGPVIYNPFNTSLPITLAAFRAVINKADVQLQWQTHSEINSAFFELEKSEDGQLFHKLTSINATGNASTVHDYNFVDTDAFKKANVIFYRLKLIDKDGSFKYSQVVSVRFNGKQGLQISNYYPTILSGNQPITIEISSNKNQSFGIQLIDATGRILSQQTKTLIEGYNKLLIDIPSNIPSGTCFIRCTADGFLQTIPVVKQ